MKNVHALDWFQLESLAASLAKVFDFSWIVASAFIAYKLMLPLIVENNGSVEQTFPAYLPSLVLLVAIAAVICQSYLGVYKSWRGRTKVALSSRLLSGHVLTAAWVLVFGVCFKQFYPYYPVESILKTPEWMLSVPERLSLSTQLIFNINASVEPPVLQFGSLAFSRFCLIWLGLVIVGSIVFRIPVYLILNWMRSRGLNQKQLVVVGTKASLQRTQQRLLESPWLGLAIASQIVIEPNDNSVVADHCLDFDGLKQQLSQVFQEGSVSEIWICLPLKHEAAIHFILHQLRHSTVNIRYLPDFSDYQLLNHKATEVAGLYSLDLSCSPMIGSKRFIKSLEDRILAFLMLVVLSPLMFLIAIGVKLSSSGPVLFKQYRHGIGGRAIKVYKFRSMKQHQEREGEVTQASVGDTRVTAFGRFLRRTSLDELPQVINVLQGKMSLVGPRPHALAHNEQFKDQVDLYMKRHKVKPGITGWAQVNGFRGETDTLDKMRQRVEHDLFYIDNWSLKFDLKILVMTLVKGFVHRNAY